MLTGRNIHIIEPIDPTTGDEFAFRRFFARNLVHSFHKVIRHARFVERELPHHHTGMVSVATDQFTRIAVRMFHEFFIAYELPARNSGNSKQSQFVAGIHKGIGLRIMR